MEKAKDQAFPVLLEPLPQPVKCMMQAALMRCSSLGAVEELILGPEGLGARTLQTYLLLERLSDSQLADTLPLRLVNGSKQQVLAACRRLAALPERNRTALEAPVPLGVTKASLESNRTEVVRQFRSYTELMANTRVAQADKYLAHAARRIHGQKSSSYALVCCMLQ